MGLELNLLSFVPLIIEDKNRYSSEARLKYFLIQALGSSLIIFAASAILLHEALSAIIILSALLLKLGAAPFHFWLPQVIGGLIWPQLILLITVQKIAPLFLISYFSTFHGVLTLLTLSAILSAIVGSVGGINQTSLRKIIAFSSINHIAWILLAGVIREASLLFYFAFYCIISASLAILFHFLQAFHFSCLVRVKASRRTIKVVSLLSLLSLGGLPPFTGFLPKWVIIQELVLTGAYVSLRVLLARALITLYFYLRVAISSLLFSSPRLKPAALGVRYVFKWTPLFVLLNFFGLLAPSLMVLF